MPMVRLGLRVLLAGLLVVIATLAGCLNDDKVGGDDLPPVHFSDTTGGIRGTVADEIFEPLADAGIKIRANATEPPLHEATTGTNGIFTVDHVEPGIYRLRVNATGYHTQDSVFRVTAGELTELRVLMDPVAPPTPFHSGFERTGLITWSASWHAEVPSMGCVTQPSPELFDIKTCSGFTDSEATAVETRWGPERDPEGWPSIEDPDHKRVSMTHAKTIIVELRWTPAGPLGEHFSLDLMCSDAPRGPAGAITDPDHPCYKETNGASPLRLRFDEEDWLRDGFDHNGTWAARVFATYGMLDSYDATGADIGLAYQQEFDIHWTVFYHEPAPEGFSGLPDA